jgi:hypothetical protein
VRQGSVRSETPDWGGPFREPIALFLQYLTGVPGLLDSHLQAKPGSQRYRRDNRSAAHGTSIARIRTSTSLQSTLSPPAGSPVPGAMRARSEGDSFVTDTHLGGLVVAKTVGLLVGGLEAAPGVGGNPEVALAVPQLLGLPLPSRRLSVRPRSWYCRGRLRHRCGCLGSRSRNEKSRTL